MDIESIFKIIFILFVLAIPCGLGLGLWRAILKRKDIIELFTEAKYDVGRVVGYTERKYDTENTHDYYSVIEYSNEDNEVIWAESEGCGKDDYAINSQINIMYHPRDVRYVMLAINPDIARMRANFEKNIELFIMLIIAVLFFGSVIYYYGLISYILAALSLSYAVGFLFGAITNNRSGFEEKSRIQYSEHRNKRLVLAQEKGEIPCILKE